MNIAHLIETLGVIHTILIGLIIGVAIMIIIELVDLFTAKSTEYCNYYKRCTLKKLGVIAIILNVLAILILGIKQAI